jgi:hypothetical protein
MSDPVTKALAEANNKLTEEVKNLQAENARLKTKLGKNKEKKQQSGDKPAKAASGEKPAKKAKAPEEPAEKGSSDAADDIAWLSGRTTAKIVSTARSATSAPSTERKCSQCKKPLAEGGHEKCREAMKKKRAEREKEEKESGEDE